VTYQAKDIQGILRIPKVRYAYLSREIGIRPDVEEVVGTGKVHLYSYKNLLQFFIAEECNRIGLSMKATKFLMESLVNYDHKHRLNLFYPYIEKKIEGMPKKNWNWKAILLGEDFKSTYNRVAGSEHKHELMLYFFAQYGGGVLVIYGKEPEVLTLCLVPEEKKSLNETAVELQNIVEDLWDFRKIIDFMFTGYIHLNLLAMKVELLRSEHTYLSKINKKLEDENTRLQEILNSRVIEGERNSDT